MAKTLSFAGSDYAYGWWGGETLRTSDAAPAAFDTETRLIAELEPGVIDPRDVPALALAMAWDGSRLFLIHADDVAAFFGVNRDAHLVGHNLAFDFWVCHRHLERDRLRQRTLWSLGDRNRLHDTMVLDQLLQLGTGRYRGVGGVGGDDAKMYPTNLGVLAAECGVGDVDKESPYRLRFGELIGLSKAEIEAHPEFAGFAEYALGDVIATRAVYLRQREQSAAVLNSVGAGDRKPQREVYADAAAKWGPLTEATQVRASIALAELSRTPLSIDVARRAEMEAATRAAYDAALAMLDAEAPGLFRRYKAKRFAGRWMTTKTSAVPKMDTGVLKAKLAAVAAGLDRPAPQNPGKTGGVSTSAKAWTGFKADSPFVAAWCDLEHHAKRLEFLRALDADAVYARYSLLMRSGRTSASAWRTRKRLVLPSVNVQQMPRDSDVRDLFVAPPGKVLLTVDYSYVELRTLAACCVARFGESKLADVILAHTAGVGPDPHVWMAAKLLGRSLAEYAALSDAEKKSARQAAKAVNFGRPGGLGDEKFRAYAAASYGVSFSKQRAAEAKRQWLDAYPEMRLWLADRTRDAVAWQLKVSPARLRWLSDVQLRLLSDLCRGAAQTETQRDAAWSVAAALGQFARRSDVVAAAEERTLTPAVRRLTTYRACTPTGRVRADTKYTDGANTPFQGLAADGAKEAVWRLMYAGFRVVAFVHDEIVVELDAKTASRDRVRVEKIMNDAMAGVLGGVVPSAVESHLGERWCKA